MEERTVLGPCRSELRSEVQEQSVYEQNSLGTSSRRGRNVKWQQRSTSFLPESCREGEEKPWGVIKKIWATRESGKGFQTGKEEKDKLGQNFRKDPKHQNCVYIVMREQRMFCPRGLWGLEGDKPVTCSWSGEGGENEVSRGRRSHVICLVSFARNPWRQKFDGTSWGFEKWKKMSDWESGLACFRSWLFSKGKRNRRWKMSLLHRNLTGSCDFHYQYSVTC